MKLLIFFTVIYFSIQTISAQKTIIAGGEKIKMQIVDSTKFNIKGVWKIIDRKYFYDDGEYNKKKWDELDKGNAVFISDSIINVCTYSLVPNLIINPIFIKSFDTDFSQDGTFFKQFNDTVLHFSVWGKDDLSRAIERQIEDPVATFEIIVLNNDYIVIAQANSFRYLKRMENFNNDEGWKKEENYEKINFVDNGVIRIKVLKGRQTKEGYFEFIFKPSNSNCATGILEILAPTTSELQSSRRLGCELFKDGNRNGLIIKGKIPLNQLKSSYLRIGYLIKNINCQNRGVLLWRITQ